VSPDHYAVLYTPDSNFVGTDSCVYEACDGRNSPFCDTATVYFTVLAAIESPTSRPTMHPSSKPSHLPTQYPIPSPSAKPVISRPVAVNDYIVADANTPIRINVLDNDFQGDDRYPLSVNDILPPQAANGVCEVSMDHLGVIYTPNSGFDGVDRCVYRMCDSRGEPFCDTATITITIRAEIPAPSPKPSSHFTHRPTISTPTHKPTSHPSALPNNDFPVAVDDVVLMSSNEIARVAVLENDIQGSLMFPLEVIQIIQNDFQINSLHNALNGVCEVSIDRIHVIYTPNEDFDGVDECVYEMCDSRGSPYCNTATITFHVRQVIAFNPTNSPTFEPSLLPTLNPTVSPMFTPTLTPTMKPTSLPTNHPSRSPITPTRNPTLSPSKHPTKSPSLSPTFSPTFSPTQSPSLHPTSKPTPEPTLFPTMYDPYPGKRTKRPTKRPTSHPTRRPTSHKKPSGKPGRKPSHSGSYGSIVNDIDINIVNDNENYNENNNHNVITNKNEII